MLPSRVLLVDSNFLRVPNLRDFLAQSSENAIALDHLVLFEIFKTNPLLTSRKSLLIAAEFVDQVYVIKPSHRWLNKVITCEEDLEGLIDEDATAALRECCHGLFDDPPSQDVASYLAAREVEAAQYLARLTDEMGEYEEALRDRAAQFSKGQLTEIRTGVDVSDKTREQISEMLHEVTGHFILSYQEPGRTQPLATAMARNMFAFRYALCVVLFYIEWVQSGRTSKGLTKRVNDIIDLQIATASTFFSGLASNDALTLSVGRAATRLLAQWGAFIRFSDAPNQNNLS